MKEFKLPKYLFQVNTLGAQNPLTKLVVDLSGIDPDDAFSSCPYEKGHTFLFYLEKMFGACECIFKLIC